MGAGRLQAEEDDDGWLRESRSLGTAFERLFGRPSAPGAPPGGGTGSRRQVVTRSPASEAATLADELAALRAPAKAHAGEALVDPEPGPEQDEELVDAESQEAEEGEEVREELDLESAGLVVASDLNGKGKGKDGRKELRNGAAAAQAASDLNGKGKGKDGRKRLRNGAAAVQVSNPSHFVVDVVPRLAGAEKIVQGIPAPKLMPIKPKGGVLARPAGPKAVGIMARGAEGPAENAAAAIAVPPPKKARVASSKWAPPEADAPAALRAAGRASSLLLCKPGGAREDLEAVPPAAPPNAPLRAKAAGAASRAPTRPQPRRAWQHAAQRSAHHGPDSGSESSACSL